MKEKYLLMFKNICKESNKHPITEWLGCGFTTYFKWAGGKVTKGYGMTREESVKDFEKAICVQYEGWGLK